MKLQFFKPIQRGRVLITGIIEEYLFEKFLDRISGRLRRYYWIYWKGEKPPEVQKEEKIEKLQEREENLLAEMKEKDDQIEEVESRLEIIRDDLTVRERLIESLDRDGVRRTELLDKYDDEIPFIVINYNKNEPDRWLIEKLKEEYNAEGLSGGGAVIPPEEVPDNLKNNKRSIDNWWEENILEEGKKILLVHATLGDLRNVTWHDDFPKYSTWTIQEAIDVEDYLPDDFYELDEVTNSIEHIEKGDIGFLASKYVTRQEIKSIHENQKKIEKRLGNPNIRELGNEEMKPELAEVLDGYVADPENVASGVIFQAKICREVFFDEDMDLDVEELTDTEENKLQKQEPSQN